MMVELFVSLAGRFGINTKEARRFAKFLVVGTIGFIVDFGTLTFLVEVAALPTLVETRTAYSDTVGFILANTISFSLAVFSNFTFNRYWTYPESRSKKKRFQLPQFATVSILGLILNNTIFASTLPLFDRLVASVEAIPLSGYMIAKAVATVVVLFWNFFVNRYWTYRHVK